MKKILLESLNEVSLINIEDEMQTYSEMEASIAEDEEYKTDYENAIKEFGVNTDSLGIIPSYSVDTDWEDLKDEMDKRQIEYYEFDLYDDESVILFDLQDLHNQEDEE